MASSWGQNRAQEAIQEQLTKMLKISTTLERELHFQGFWAPKLVQKSMKNQQKNPPKINNKSIQIYQKLEVHF